MAEDDNVLIGVKLLVRPCGHISHRHCQAALDAGSGNLPRLAHVDKAGLPLPEKRSRIGGRYLVIQHESSLKLPAGARLSVIEMAYATHRVPKPPAGSSEGRTDCIECPYAECRKGFNCRRRTSCPDGARGDNSLRGNSYIEGTGWHRGLGKNAGMGAGDRRD